MRKSGSVDRGMGENVFNLSSVEEKVMIAARLDFAVAPGMVD